MKSVNELTLGFIGGGNMAEAIIKGLLGSRILDAARMMVSDPAEERRTLLSETFGIQTVTENAEVIDRADIVVLAVKPQFMAEALDGLSSAFRDDQVVVSIAAGLRGEKIDALCGGVSAIIRVMPNTPALVGKGVSAICKGPRAGDDHIAMCRTLFDSVGRTLVVDESAMDAVTAVSGSGPAYVFAWLEAMLKAAENEGFDAGQARELVYGTFEGAVTLALKTDDHPSRLRERVTSRGGTTEAALNVMREKGVEQIIGEAVKAAVQRSKELS